MNITIAQSHHRYLPQMELNQNLHWVVTQWTQLQLLRHSIGAIVVGLRRLQLHNCPPGKLRSVYTDSIGGIFLVCWKTESALSLEGVERKGLGPGPGRIAL